MLDDVFRAACGRGVARRGVPGVLPSVRGKGESFLKDRAEGALGRPAAEPVRWSPSPVDAASAPGAGELADDPLVAAAALRS